MRCYFGEYVRHYVTYWKWFTEYLLWFSMQVPDYKPSFTRRLHMGLTLPRRFDEFSTFIQGALLSVINIESYMMTPSIGNISRVTGLCEGNSPVTGEFPSQRPMTRSVDTFFDLHLNERLSQQSWGWWFETPSRSLWRHCNALIWLSVVLNKSD